MPLIDDESAPKQLELTFGESFYLEYQIDREGNPKGSVKYMLKKSYGTAEIWISESVKRPGPHTASKKEVIKVVVSIIYANLIPMI